jgi:arylsulfatase A-like enzyme
VVVIVVDTLRADHVGCYGAEHPTTPSIDRFAAGAIQFHDALAVAPWTTPSIAAMLSSRYPSEVSWRHPPVPLAPSVVSLPELFKDAGYRTGAIVSHLYVSRQLGFDQGFDLYDQDNARGHRHISSPSVTRKALDFLERHQDERFFLFLHYFDPHSDFLRHSRYDFFPDYAGPVRPDAPLGELLRQAPEMSAEDLRYVRALYDSEIRFTDDHVGWVLTRLRELGLYDDALIVITSDHGEEFAERGTHYIGHGTHLHRELLHVPLLIKPPHHTGHRDVEQAVSLIDLAPTLVRAAGLDAFDPVWFRGRALPLDGTRIPAAPAFSDNAGRRLSVVSGGWKLMRDGDPPRDRLFELATDPTEQRDRLADHPEHARTLRAALETWLTATSQTTRVEGTASFTPEQQEQLRALGYAE